MLGWGVRCVVEVELCPLYDSAVRKQALLTTLEMQLEIQRRHPQAPSFETRVGNQMPQSVTEVPVSVLLAVVRKRKVSSGTLSSATITTGMINQLLLQLREEQLLDQATIGLRVPIILRLQLVQILRQVLLETMNPPLLCPAYNASVLVSLRA